MLEMYLLWDILAAAGKVMQKSNFMKLKFRYLMSLEVTVRDLPLLKSD